MTLKVISICGGVGFPVGLATTQTIAYIAGALREMGAATTVLHCGPHPYLPAVPRTGEHRGTRYRYLGATTQRPTSWGLRALCYLTAYVELAYRLAALRIARTDAVTVVCLHVQGCTLNLYAGILCTILRFPIVIESCEWEPDFPGTSAFVKWIYRQVMFRFCSRAIVISRQIEANITSLDVYRHRPFPMHRT